MLSFTGGGSMYTYTSTGTSTKSHEFSWTNERSFDFTLGYA